MRGSLALALDQAAASEQFVPEVSLEAIELMSMDAKQVIRDLDVWEEEFDGLGQEFSDLKRQAKT
jgi:peroxiredoxin